MRGRSLDLMGRVALAQEGGPGASFHVHLLRAAPSTWAE